MAVAIMLLGVLACYVTPRTYEAKSTVFIERSVINALTKDMAVAPSTEDRVRVLVYTLLSRNMLLKTIDDLGLGRDSSGNKDEGKIEGLLNNFQKATIIKTQEDRRETDFFTVSYQSSDPILASNFVNALIHRYIEDNVASKREESQGANRFIEDQIAHFRKKLDKAEADLEAFVREKGIRAAGRGARGGGDRVRGLEARLKDLQLRYTDNHPDVVRLKDEIAALKSRPSSERYAPAATAVPDEAVNDKAGRRYSMQGLSAADRIKLISLDRDREAIKTTYEELVARLSKSELSKQIAIGDGIPSFRIIDPAVVPTKPISPNRPKIILMGILAGLVGAAGFVIIRDRMDSSVRSVDTVKNLGLPVLAIIPHMTLESDLAKQRQADQATYKVAGAFAAVVLLIMVLETLGYSPVDAVFGQMHSVLSGVKTSAPKAL
ncbi:MAG TPA: GNVR domain-containing protein [Dissulfurispiraceae bacterium]|nr:GNVR domain-containing protein [Dissulfurispiraceae bacterium]